MRINRVRVARVPLDVVNPLRTATGTHRTRTASLVEVTTDDGTVGWGENVAPEGDFYTGETASLSHRAMCTDLLAQVVACPDLTPHEMVGRWWEVQGWPMAKHALSSAVWDAWARSRKESLAKSLGGRVHPVRVGVVVGLGRSVAETVSECEQVVREGYSSIKLKISPGHDVELVRSVRSALGDEIEIHADANGSYGPSDIDRVVRTCAEGVSLMEQPFGRADLESHAHLVAATRSLVGLDESVETEADLARAFEMGACSAINVKPSRVGGFADALSIVEMCRQRQIPVWVGGMLESAVGRAGALALATHPWCTLPADLSASSRYFTCDLAPAFVLDEGTLSVPAGPGLGRVPDAEALAAKETMIETVFER